jgi:hypothetical protein
LIADDTYTFEIGGKNKRFKQIKEIKYSFIVVDTDSTQNGVLNNAGALISPPQLPLT